MHELLQPLSEDGVAQLQRGGGGHRGGLGGRDQEQKCLDQLAVVHLFDDGLTQVNQ